jgi:hypothetical protein
MDRFELGIAPKCLGYSLVFVLKDWWERFEEVSCRTALSLSDKF